MKELLLAHAHLFPGLTVEDGIKFLYQSHMGPGHLISDPAKALALSRVEMDAIPENPDAPLSLPLGNGLCRLNLDACKARGIPPEVVARIFCATASGAARDLAALDRDLDLLYLLPFPREEVAAALDQYRSKGLPPLRHSSSFRRQYHPAYRVVFAKYLPYLSLFTQIETLMTQIPKVRVAIDGPCAAGKSTLAALLQEVYGCPLIHMDHFFLPPELSTPQRLAQPGGNVDYDRFFETVYRPLTAGAAFSYSPWNCKDQLYDPPVLIPAAPLTVVEGCYALREEFRSAYHLRLFLTAPWPLRRQRLGARNGADGLRRFEDVWIPLEDAYFSACGVEACCHMVLSSDEDELLRI